jgi:hypothetical protein
MSDLNALKNQFMALQKKKSNFKLSERTVVEIVLKIINRGKVNLLHTTSGKEYVVDGKANIEIANEIKKRKRITTFELSSYLELPIALIEKKVDELIKKNKNFLLVDGKIMTKEYLEKITMEINDLVNKEGSASLADISNKYDLSIDFLKNLLKEKISEGSLNAKLFPTRIITDYYIQNQIKKIRPILLANINPISTNKILSKYSDIDELLLNDNINNLIKSGQVKGTFMNNQFENALYHKNQENYIKGELRQNHFIQLSKLKNVGINKDEEELVENIVNKNPELKGTLINGYYITEKLKNDLNDLCSLIKENGEKNLPTNLKENELLMTFGEDDIKILLESMELSEKDFAFINCNYIPMELINRFALDAKNDIKSIASQLFAECEQKIEEQKKLEEKEEDKNPKKENKKSNKNKNKPFLDLKYPKNEGEKVMNNIMKSTVFENINEKRDTLKEVYEKKVLRKLKNMFENEILELIKEKELKEKKEKEAQKEKEKEKKEDAKDNKEGKGGKEIKSDNENKKTKK